MWCGVVAHYSKSYIYTCMVISNTTYVAVPGRNRTLFRCVFWSHCCVRSAVAQNFRLGQGSYALCKRGKYWWVYPARMSPALNESSMLQCFECSNASEIRNGIMCDFYPGLPYMAFQNQTFCCVFWPDYHGWSTVGKTSVKGSETHTCTCSVGAWIPESLYELRH